MQPMPIVNVINTNNDTTYVERCLSKSENLDILYKINEQQELNEEDKTRLEDCVKQKEHIGGIFDTIAKVLMVLAIVLIIGVIIGTVRMFFY